LTLGVRKFPFLEFSPHIPSYPPHRCSRKFPKPRFHFHFDSDFAVTDPIMGTMGPVQTRGKRNCYTVLFLHFFQKALPATNRESPQGRGEERGLCAHFPASSCERARALPFPSWGAGLRITSP
jgi:hypothetical protein